jgi:hypothetical protein
VTWLSTVHDRLDDGRWKPFAVSVAATLFVAAVHTGALDAVLLAAYRVQSLGG